MSVSAIASGEKQEQRPFSLTEDNFNDFESAVKALRLFEELASEFNSAAGGLSNDLVAATIGLVADKLSAVLDSAGNSFS